MDAKEKWKRLNNPQGVEDYGLLMTGDELKQFAEGRELLKAVESFELARKSLKKDLGEIEGIAAKLGRHCAKTIEKITYGCFEIFRGGLMDELELEARLQAELSEQKRWQDLDYGMAAWHEGRASAFKEQLADLAKTPDAADAELKKLGVEIRGLKSNKSKQ